MDWTGIGLIIGAIGTALFGLYKGIRTTFDPKAAWQKTFEGSEEIDHLLNDFIQDTEGIDNISLIKCKNGGGVPHPTSVIRTSIISEGVSGNEFKYKDHWQDVVADSYYKTFLRNCLANGSYLVEDSKKLENSIIKDAALSLGVTSFKLIYAKAFTSSWYYLVISTTKGKVNQDAKTNDEVRVLIGNLLQYIY